jgi:hypothetical protein
MTQPIANYPGIIAYIAQASRGIASKIIITAQIKLGALFSPLAPTTHECVL